MISNGLGQDFSAGEIRRLKERLTVTEETAREAGNSNYYASTLPNGPKRLIELVEESAFYSAKLHKVSANVLVFIIASFVITFAILAIYAIPTFSNDLLMIGARLFFAVTIFVLSTDVIGAFIAHGYCSKLAHDIVGRAETLGESEVREVDAILLLEDYTSAIERAPEIVPFAYKWKEKHLNQLWSEYQADKH